MMTTLTIVGVLAVFLLLNAIHKKFFTRYGKEMTWMLALLRPVVRVVFFFWYRIRRDGFENIPETGGALIIANHRTWIDVVLMSMICPRPIRFLSSAEFEHAFFLKWIMRGMNTIPVSPEKARSALKSAEKYLLKGELVGIFPEACISRNNSMQPFKPGFERLASKTGVPVIPLFIDGLWRSIFSNRFKKFFWKIPQIERLDVAFFFGRPFYMGTNAPAGQPVKTIVQARKTLLELQERAFSSRRVFANTHVMEMMVKACSKHPFKLAVVDYSLERKPFSRGIVAAVSYCLSKRIRKELPERRVGIVMPSGAPGMIANYAISLADKIPVNLNFTLGKAQIESCIARGNIKTMVSMAPVKNLIQNRLPDFPWTENQIDILDWIRKCNKLEIIIALLQLVFLPSCVLKHLWNIPQHGGNDEAALLFTSGSSGMPKAAVITHKNLIANVMQVDEFEIIPQWERNMLCNLPIFHCFGFLTLLWCPTMLDIVAIATPSPLDYAKNVQAIERDKVSIALSTPTFYRGYLKKATAEQMRSLKITIAGAEKTPEGFDKLWMEKFPSSTYLNGYGMTEASPVVSIQRPDVPVKGTKTFHIGFKKGSVGVLLPGMCAKVLDPDTGKELGFNEAGMLYIKGANIFGGYLNDDGHPVPATDADGWYKTGDIVELDEADFITIRGRLARFSKIGGEMVPHGTIEEAIVDELKLGEEEVKIAISGRADDSKGEQIVLISAIPDLNLAELNKKLSARGMANLWLPRDICYVDKIPVLGTGKLDIKTCAAIANQK
ncbi:MAG: AMP-binding protein [Opitutales bacterium]|nr:AMP-binding protein [Opitutales bacterium]